MFLATLFGFWVDLNLLVNGFVLEKRKPEPPTLQQIITHICNTVSLSNTSLHYEKYHQPVRTQMCEFIELYCINCIFTLFIRCFNKINLYIYTGYTQKNGAVSKGNKEFISHFTRAQRTPSAAETLQVSHALPAVRFSCLMRGRGAVSKMASQQEKALCVLHFEVSRSVITAQREFRARFRKDAPCMVRLF